MNASDLMTTPPITLRDDAGLPEALRLMVSKQISGVPVVDGSGNLVGMLTEGDLLRRAELGTGDRHWSGLWSFIRGPGPEAGNYVQANSRRVADLMTTDPVAVAETTPVADIVELIEHKRIKRVPVVRNGLVVGVVSRADLLRAVDRAMSQPGVSGGGDDAILARLRAELAGQKWFSEESIKLTVRDGVVGLAGVITDQRMRDALRVAAQKISGRTEVRDELELLEPVTGTVLP